MPDMTTADRHFEEGRALLQDGAVCHHGNPRGFSNYDVRWCGECETEEAAEIAASLTDVLSLFVDEILRAANAERPTPPSEHTGTFQEMQESAERWFEREMADTFAGALVARKGSEDVASVARWVLSTFHRRLRLLAAHPPEISDDADALPRWAAEVAGLARSGPVVLRLHALAGDR